MDKHVDWGLLQHSGVGQDCGSTGQTIDPAPGAWFIPKFISFVPSCPRPSIALQLLNPGLTHPLILPVFQIRDTHHTYQYITGYMVT